MKSLHHSLTFIIVFTSAHYSLEVSYVPLIMNEEGDLLVYKNKGKPNVKEVESLRVNSNLRIGFNQLNKNI